MTAQDEDSGRSSALLRAMHPLFIGVVTAISSQVAVWGLLVAAFTNVVVLLGAVVAIPVAYVAVISAITRATTGRAHVWWNIALAVTLIAFGVTVSLAATELPLFGGVTALPLSLGLAAAVSSLVVMPRPARVVGVVAIAAQIAVVAVPFVAAQARIGEREAAADAAELQRRNEMNTRPYIVPGLVVQIVLPTDYQTDVKLSRDPSAASRGRYSLDDSDITLSTAPLVPGQSVESEACRSILDPDVGGSPSNVCDRLDADTWVLQAGGETSVVRLQDGNRLEISDGGRETGELVALLDAAERMSVPQFEDWNAWLYERDKRV